MDKSIIKYPNPILRKKCPEIKEITSEIQELASSMAESMVKGQGIGLAAPQIGESKRIIVIQTKDGVESFVNPKIIKKGKAKGIAEEGCLSFPGLYLKIKRAKEVEVEYLNLLGEKNKIKVNNLLARVFQHEIDHLNGILFIDRISFWEKFQRLLGKK